MKLTDKLQCNNNRAITKLKFCIMVRVCCNKHYILIYINIIIIIIIGKTSVGQNIYIYI